MRFIIIYLLKQEYGLMENFQKDKHVKESLINWKLTLFSFLSFPLLLFLHPFFHSSIEPSILAPSYLLELVSYTFLLACSSPATLSFLLHKETWFTLALGSFQNLCSSAWDAALLDPCMAVCLCHPGVSWSATTWEKPSFKQLV